MMKPFLIAAVCTIGLTACASQAAAYPAPAYAGAYSSKGSWVLNPNKCPDLIEDRLDRRENRRDERYTYSRRDAREDRRDRREDRRDRAVTRCPASAWEWHGPRYFRAKHPARPAAIAIYYDTGKRHYYYPRGRTRVIIRF